MWAKNKRETTDRFRRLAFSLVLSCTLAALPFLVVPPAFAETNLMSRYDTLGDGRPGVITTHRIGFTYTDLSVPIGSVLVQFCANTPIIGDPCTPPPGFDLSATSLTTQTGEAGFSILPAPTQNELIMTRPAVIPSAGQSTYVFQNILSPNQIGTYYVRLQTFTSTDATGLAVQVGGIAIAATEGITVQTEVPPYLTFCAGVTIVSLDCSSANSYFIDLGEFSKTQTKSATSQMVAATNAQYGYSIFATGTTFTSGNNTIPAPVIPSPSVAGSNQFGINLRANAQPALGSDVTGPGTAGVTPNYSIPDRFMYHPGDSVASSGNSSDYRKYTVTYIVNIGDTQPAGVYSTTLTYICLANF